MTLVLLGALAALATLRMPAFIAQERTLRDLFWYVGRLRPMIRAIHGSQETQYRYSPQHPAALLGLVRPFCKKSPVVIPHDVRHCPHLKAQA